MTPSYSTSHITFPVHVHIVYLRQREVYIFAHVRLSICLRARLLKNVRINLDEMLRVDGCQDICRDMDELINF